MPKTPIFRSLREAVMYCGQRVEEPPDPPEISNADQLGNLDEKQKALAKEQPAD